MSHQASMQFFSVWCYGWCLNNNVQPAKSNPTLTEWMQ